MGRTRVTGGARGIGTTTASDRSAGLEARRACHGGPAWVGTVLLSLASCTPKGAGDQGAPTTGSAGPATMELRCSAFGPGSSIPQKHTCEGDDVAPPLSWSGVPSGTKSLVLIVDDPDAPDPKAPKTTWVHWVLYDMPPSAAGLPEGGQPLPAGTREGLNDWKRTGYGGPCPPVGRHRYVHKIYALDVTLSALESPSKRDLEEAMAGHVLARGELIGTYEKAAASGSTP